MALNGSQVFLYFVQQLCQSELLEHSVCTIGMSFFCQFVTYASVSSQLHCVSNTQNIFFDNCCLCKTRRAEAGAQEIYNSIFLCKRTAKAEQIYVKCKQRPFECKGRVILWNWTIFSWIKIKKRPPESELFLLQRVSTTVPVFGFVIVLSIFWPWCEAGLYVKDPEAVAFIQAPYTSTAFIL